MRDDQTANLATALETITRQAWSDAHAAPAGAFPRRARRAVKIANAARLLTRYAHEAAADDDQVHK